MAIYAPEMGQEAPVRVFFSEHNFGNSYCLCWKVEDDECARAVLKALRVRPAFHTTVELKKQGDYSVATRNKSDMFGCLITGSAHRKLMDADVTVQRELLD